MWIPRGWKKADSVAATRDFLRHKPPRRAAIRELITELLSPEPFARRCAADLARRVSAREPGVLKNYADVLIDLVSELGDDQWQARGYIAQATALNTVTPIQRGRLAGMLRAMADDQRIGLRAMALEALANLAVADANLREEVLILLENARVDPVCAMRSRARRMLPVLLMASEEKPE
ncbi:MAG: hypothetical protein ACLPY1_20860 [Terracidiphilus sp.]